jgi:predicted flavoprotein YhiN
MQRHGIAFHEKHKGQLFCDRSAEDLIRCCWLSALRAACTRWQPCGVQALRHTALRL